MWLKSYQQRRGMAKARKLQSKFIGPYKIIEVLTYHTYRLSRDSKENVEHEARIKLHVAHSAEPASLPLPPLPTPKQVRAPPASRSLPQLPTSYGNYTPRAIEQPHTLEIESLPNLTPRHEFDWPAIEAGCPHSPVVEEPATPRRRQTPRSQSRTPTRTGNVVRRCAVMRTTAHLQTRCRWPLPNQSQPTPHPQSPLEHQPVRRQWIRQNSPPWRKPLKFAVGTLPGGEKCRSVLLATTCSRSACVPALFHTGKITPCH